MSEAIQAFPLQWPVGWRRTPSYQRTSAKFRRKSSSHDDRLNVGQGAERVYRELRAMGIAESKIIISSDLRLRLDGKPYADQATGRMDPGVAVYWSDGNQQRCMAVDRYDRIADNLAAVAATIEAMRSIERHGGATILDRAFQGFTALPAPESWWQVLGLKGPNASRADIEQAHRRLIMDHHPDRPGGDVEKAARINRARDQGLEASNV